MSPRLKVCPYYVPAYGCRLEKSAGLPRWREGSSFYWDPLPLPSVHPSLPPRPPAPPSGAESTVSPILMYLLWPTRCPLAFHSVLPVLPPFISHYEAQLLGIRRERGDCPEDPLVPLSLAAARARARARRVRAPAHRLRDEPGQDRVTGFPK